VYDTLEHTCPLAALNSPHMPTREERYRGALIGLAAGDALGTTLEFKPPGTFEPIGDMIGGGPFNLEAGQWTDDTSMALCMAESLIESNGFDPVDQLSRYVRWKRDGHHSSIGRCFDIGGTVRAALARFERFREPWSGSTDEFSAGNGSLMRLAPVPLFFAAQPEIAIARAADSSRTTHGATEAIDACRHFAGLIVGALHGKSREALLAPMFTPVEGLWDREPLAPKIHEIAAGSFLTRNPPEIRGTGYVVASLEAALWAFAKSTSFEHGALLAVNLGDDADTTGAVYGQLAGAYYGVEGIPLNWRHKLAGLPTLERFAVELLKRAT
jgi:ADP-ribosyl-[dinitrogen reductase] hydrolase